MNDNVFRDFTYGMYVVTAKSEGKNIGFAANSVAQVTANNPIITVSINKKIHSNEEIKKSGKFAVSVLSEQTNPEVISKFGYCSSRNVDKFAGFKFEEIRGVPVIKENICSYMVCELLQVIDCETHDIFLGRVVEAEKETSLLPMSYDYYQKCLKKSK